MALPPVLVNRNSLDQQLEREFARIDAKFQPINFYLSIMKYSGLFVVFTGVGVVATEQRGKKRSLTNKIFLGASLVGIAGVVCSLVAAVAVAYSTFSQSDKN